MAIIGDQFDDCRSKAEDNPKSRIASNGKSEDDSDTTEWPEICGCTISVRQSEDVVTVWNKVDGDVKLREQIRCVFLEMLPLFVGAQYIECSDTLRRVLNLPQSTIMEYKSNNGETPQRRCIAFCAYLRILQTRCKTN